MKTVEISKWPEDAPPPGHVYDPPPFVRFQKVPIDQTDTGSYACSHPGFPPHQVIVKISQVFSDPNRAKAEVDGYHSWS